MESCGRNFNRLTSSNKKGLIWLRRNTPNRPTIEAGDSSAMLLEPLDKHRNTFFDLHFWRIAQMLLGLADVRISHRHISSLCWQSFYNRLATQRLLQEFNESAQS